MHPLKTYVPLAVRSGGRQIFNRLQQFIFKGLGVLPDYVIIGAQKAGTTSLYNYLLLHPDIAPAIKKEVHFFDWNYSKGLHWYRSYFPARIRKYRGRLHGRKIVTGEASPYYLFHPLVAARIRRDIPRIKLIAVLRNPVDRSYSHYQMRVREGVEPLSFEEAIEKEQERIAGEVERMITDPKYVSSIHHVYSYLTRSNYVEQFERWLKLFSRESMLVIKSEELLHQPACVLPKVHAFLELPVCQTDSHEIHNRFDYVAMCTETRERLCRYFRPFNERLYQLLGVDWRWEEDD